MKYRILLINWQDITNPLGGGAEVHAHEIFRRITDLGHEVTELCCSYPGAPREEIIDGIRIVRYGKRPVFNFFVPSMYQILSKRHSFDIIFDDINKIPFYTPQYVKEPVVAIIHHLFGKSIFLETKWPQAMYVHTSERAIKTIYKKTRFMTVSESSRQELLKWNLRCNKTDIVYNGVDHVKYTAKPGMKSPIPLIGYLGRLKKYKCIEHIIEAFPLISKKIPDIRLIIMGDGDYRKDLEKKAFQLGINNRIQFTGLIDHKEKVDILNQTWVVINPSPKEGWGLTVIESNACGVPVIAADSPGLHDSVVDGQTGFLYSWGTINQMADKVVKVLTNNILRQELEKGAIAWAKNFNWDNSASKTLGIIESELTK
jgi:glycosyltransferase involved in cell wall biosynthesis